MHVERDLHESVIIPCEDDFDETVGYGSGHSYSGSSSLGNCGRSHRKVPSADEFHPAALGALGSHEDRVEETLPIFRPPEPIDIYRVRTQTL